MRTASRQELDQLRSLQMFRELRTRELREVAALVQHTRLPAGWRLTKQGQAGTEAFILLAGTAIVEIDGVQVAQLGPGDTIGEMALLDGAPRSATVTARTDVSVLFVTPQSLDTLLAMHRVAEAVIRTMGARLRRIEASPRSW